MAKQNLQSLVQRAALFAGARVTGLECNDLFAAMVDNPAGSPSLPWRPLPGQHAMHLRLAPAHPAQPRVTQGGMQIGTKPAECRRSYSPDSFGRRAGRSARNAGVVGNVTRATKR